MVALWDWLDALDAGAKSRPRVEIWPRGGAKSSTVELGVCRCCAKLSRRFVLYVSDIQDQADNHVQNISDFLQSLGAQPAMHEVNKGKAKAWRHNQLRTANGFNVASFGIDAGQRGIRIEQYRPDLIIFDDVDSRHDSPLVVQKKIECLTQSILPAGSGDCAVLFVENKVHANSIASKLADGSADFLLDRDLATVEPAVVGMETALEEQEGGKRPLYRIVAGVPTWAGQDLVKCEAQINEWGLTAFLREAQHEVTAGTSFFDQFDEDRHYTFAEYVPNRRPPRWWRYYAGLDTGYSDAFAFGVAGVDELGCLHVLQSCQQTQLTPKQQAARAVAMLEEWRIDLKEVVLGYDESMDTEIDRDGMTVEAPIHAFQRAGFRTAKVGNSRKQQYAGFGLIRDLLLPQGQPSPTLRIYQGFNIDLAHAIKNATYDRLEAEKLAHDECSHLANMLRYLVSLWLKPATKPESELTNDERRALAVVKHAEAHEAIRRDRMARRNKPLGLDADGKPLKNQPAKNAFPPGF